MDLKLLICLAFAIHLVQGAPGFPSDFVWGSATAAYQVEGAFNISRGLSIWDVFAHTPGKTNNGDTGDVADDHYHRYKQDIALMKSEGLKHYRLSISWSRLFPLRSAQPNKESVDFYNDLIDTLVVSGIEPFVTLYHWDLPNYLHTGYGGWLSSAIVLDYSLYADTAFRLFGDRVKHWITFNEPLTFTVQGYGVGSHAPGRCSNRSICNQGNSSVEPYIAAHNVLLAHAAAVSIYRQKYQTEQKGVIGITLNVDWAEPLTSSDDDKAAAERHLEWQLSWYADPIFKGDYPESMKAGVGSRLPVFTAQQKAALNGSWDFFGMNHYTSGYVSLDRSPMGQSWDQDQRAAVSFERNGVPIGVRAESTWLYVVPYGIRKMLHWVADRYGNPPIYITENGVSVPNENNLPLEQALNDDFRVDYYSQYISNVSLALSEGVDVKGYFAWSFMDNYEWADGYSVRFGLHYVDYQDGLKRYPKKSAKWYSQLIQS